MNEVWVALYGSLGVLFDVFVDDEWFKNDWVPNTTVDKLSEHDIALSGTSDWEGDFVSRVAAVYDIPFVIVEAARNLCEFHSEMSMDDCINELPNMGDEFVRYIREVKMSNSASGEISFDENGDRHIPITVGEWRFDEMVPLGAWEQMPQDESGPSHSSSSSSSSAKGAVAAAPMKLAKVYGLSTEGKNVLIGTTDNSGAFTANSNASKLQFPAVVWSAGGWNVNDDPTNPDKEFKGTLKGVMESADSAVYLTPANSLVAAFFEKSGNLTDAKQQVISLLKYEMGLKSADPLGDPLIDLNDSEIVAKSLMHIIGAGDENNDAAMKLLSVKFTQIADKMSLGASFSTVLKTMPESPYSSYSGGTLCTCVTAEADAIAKEAKDSLGKLGDLDELEKNAIPNITSEYPASLNFAGLSSTEKEANTSNVFSKKFKAVVLKGNSSMFDSHAMRVDSLVNVALSNEGTPLEVGKTYSIAKDDDLTFSVDLTEVTTFPYTASFTLETIETEDLPTFSRTFSITFFGEDEFAVKEVTYSGNDLFAFTTPITADGKIAKDAIAPIAADTFTADVELVNLIDESLADGNMDVRFIAPIGLAFENSSENTDTVKVETFTRIDDAYIAAPTVFNFVAKADINSGLKTVGIQVLDQDGETIAQASKDILFVTEDQKNNLTGVNLTAQTLTIAVPADDKFAPKSIILEGDYKTWVKEAFPDNVEDGITEAELPADSKVILMSKTGNNVFFVGDELVDKIEIPVTLSKNFKFTSEVTNFIYNYNNANDDIKMVFMLDPEDTNNNIESPTLLKLRFGPAADPAP
eukprot:TRINITY_DN3091_c0_g1_i4.p1 TRINITY_DN3091_c0_g1~~TRINITY_DN3091_c0_g1_i4.p1  ORF type:complete len:808 (-),score=159.12 TRINITY_DN3091_c0_g1_i4:1633-4056(-)